MNFDNHDSRIKYYELLLEKDLDTIPYFPLPEGYRFTFYQPGDKDHWINIEISAKELLSYVQGLETWDRFYGGKEDALQERMVFIENAAGEKVATATAYIDVTGRDKSGSGWLHWVAVRRDCQGLGLSKPLISFTLNRMRELGYSHGKIPTQTTSWLACKVYLDFGFAPIPQNAVHSRDGWRIVKALTHHPALAAFDEALPEEILAQGENLVEYEAFMRLAANRYSVRKFDGRPVEQDVIEKILRAGQLAPTACNNQPQRVLVIHGQEALAKLRKCTECHFHAPAALLVCFDKDICWKRSYDGKPSGDIDASIVTTHMMLAAAALGVGSTWVMHFNPEAVRVECAIPDNWEPAALLVMGYPAEDAQPSPRHIQRKPLEEVVSYHTLNEEESL